MPRLLRLAPLVLLLLTAAAFAQSGTIYGYFVETSAGPYEPGDMFSATLYLYAAPGTSDIGTSTMVVDFNGHALSFPKAPSYGTHFEFYNFYGNVPASDCGTARYRPYLDTSAGTGIRYTNASRLTVYIDFALNLDEPTCRGGQALPDASSPVPVVDIRWQVVDPAEGMALTARSQQMYSAVGGPEAAYATGGFDGLAVVQQEIAGDDGWRMLSAPLQGNRHTVAPLSPLTIADLAEANLVQGVPGFYPEATANLYTDYTGSAWALPTGENDALLPAQGFIWYLYEEAFEPGGMSVSVGLPFMLYETGAPTLNVTSGGTIGFDTYTVDLHSNEDRWNLVGNPAPFSFQLDFGTTVIPNEGALMSNVAQVWDPSEDGGWQLLNSGDVLAPWQGFFLENNTAAALTFVSTGRASGGPFYRTGRATATLADEALRAASPHRLAFELTGTDAESGTTTTDRAVVLYLTEEAAEEWDLLDASKLTPLAERFATLAFVGERHGEEVLKAQESRPLDGEGGFVLPLAFEAAGISGPFTVTWPRLELPEAWPVTLVDQLTGEAVNLREVPSYRFEAEASRPARAIAEAAPLKLLSAPRFMLYVGAPFTTSAQDGESGLPEAFALEGNYPNPFAGTTTIRYALPEATGVRITVYDLLGRPVSVLVDEERPAGYHRVAWDASPLAAGVYLLRFEVAGQTFVHKMTLLR